ncbi:putative pentatricopeptide repeat-containing protein [Forsythia ovata]|uniref:Pentatricopeptide repeat-containing protein n=1 Tax=Forsythia ovata TaxID=205694 RepID=A0ABD1X427_9LAMI
MISCLLGARNLCPPTDTSCPPVEVSAGLDLNVEICNVLIDLYAKLGCIYDALRVFRDMPQKDLISWNTMISMYANNGDCMEALALLKEMRNKNMEADRVFFSICIND